MVTEQRQKCFEIFPHIFSFPTPTPTYPMDPGATYRYSGHSSDKRVDQDWWCSAGVLRTRVGLGVGAVIAEEALEVHWEGVCVFKVVGKHHSACHDHQLEVEHGTSGQRQRPK